jgi:GTP-binding protein
VKVEATFITSAAGAADFPTDLRGEVALVGRSNVGKSSLINALVRQRIARTSAAPGKTRLANIYRVRRGSGEPHDLVDLPGYGYARGGGEAARGFDELTRAFFGREGRTALLLVDSRHPGLQSDIEAWRWLSITIERCAVVATKIDKLARGERIRAIRELESVFGHPVMPVSAVTGEGLDELWTLIDNLTSRRNPPGKSSLNNLNRRSPSHPPRAMAEPPARQPRWGPRVAARLPKKAQRPPKK